MKDCRHAILYRTAKSPLHAILHAMLRRRYIRTLLLLLPRVSYNEAFVTWCSPFAAV